ncbi:MAG: D-alanine--D-alanine ligase family protein [Bacillota bacterium]|nr:D-alanine--D-alanine ligase family protein [Bacillota bacterium]
MASGAQGRRLRVGIIFGGRSGEHEVSLLSAASVIRALDPARFEAVPIGISKDGRWVAGPAALATLRREAHLPASGAMGALAKARDLEDGIPTARVSLLPDPTVGGNLTPAPGAAPDLNGAWPPLDVVFPVLHGPYGEDGTVQGLLELAGVAYVGAGVLGSALGMDKIAMKDAFRAHGLPVVNYVPVTRRAWERDREGVLDAVLAELRVPVFVKPANLGSSVGITKARERAQVAAALDLAARFDRRLIVEEGAQDVREIECSVLGNDEPEASVVGEVIPSQEFYDYRAKYIDEGSQLIIPADLPVEVSEELRRIAVQAFLAVDVAGMARVDFFVGHADNRIILNELNTIPGFTSISMYPKLWEASGLSYRDLITRLIELALERHHDRARSETSYDAMLCSNGGRG